MLVKSELRAKRRKVKKQMGRKVLRPDYGNDLFGELLVRGVYFCEFRVVTKNPGNTTKKLHKIAVWWDEFCS